MLLNDPHKDPNAGEGKILTLQNVNRRTFGKPFVIAVGGKADAEPLYAEKLEIANQGLRNALLVVTEHDSVYAFDADTGKNSGMFAYSDATEPVGRSRVRRLGKRRHP